MVIGYRVGQSIDFHKILNKSNNLDIKKLTTFKINLTYNPSKNVYQGLKTAAFLGLFRGFVKKSYYSKINCRI